MSFCFSLNFTHKRRKYLTIIEHIFYFIIPFSCHNLSSIHAFVLHTNGLNVDADNIPELGGFIFRDFGSKYHNLYIKTPCLIRPFSEFPSMVAIDKFDCIYIANCLMSKFRNTSVLGGHCICFKYQGTNYFIVFWFMNIWKKQSSEYF